ncbi:CIA30 family protein [Synechococcus sp. M16CYN]|uniref:CIA30 family protein n=1 Tax=Synechococcus sp. M16CYN TaxID=3103139 RepID=UPI0032521055
MQPPVFEQVLFKDSEFVGWTSLNDDVMGGTSRADCQITTEGLLLKGELIEAGGGFVSCRSPRLRPPLNLSRFSALRLDVDGEGRTLKIALGCRDGALGLTELIPGGLRWVIDAPTQKVGTTQIMISFADLRPMIRARPVLLPLRFDVSGITRLQVLHSKFGDSGSPNPGFRAGAIRLLIRSIRALS